MADEQDKKLKAEKSLNLRLMKQLNTSLTKANDLQKDANKSDTALNKNISKLNTNIANINKLLAPSKLPKSLDNLNDKVKVFTKAFDARAIPNKLNRLSNNITNLNRLLENDVHNSFKNVSKKSRTKSKSKSSSASSTSLAESRMGQGFSFSGLNTIYRTQSSGPMGLLGAPKNRSSRAITPNASMDFDPGLNTYYNMNEGISGLLEGPGGSKRKARQPRGTAMAVSTMLVKKAIFESAVFKNAIFKGTSGPGGPGGRGGSGRSDGSFGENYGARPEVEQKYQRLLPDVFAIVKGQHKVQQQYLKQTPQQLFKMMRRSGMSPDEARRAATRQARTRNVGSSVEAGLDTAKEQVMSGLTDFGVPDSFEAQIFRGIRGIKQSFKARKEGLLDPEQTQSTTGTYGKPSRFSSKGKTTDLLRTDDKLEKKRDDKRNKLLSDILTTLKGGKRGTESGGILSSLLKGGGGFLGSLLGKGGGLLRGAGGAIMSGLGAAGSAIGTAGSAIAGGAGSLLAAGGTAVGAAGAATVAGVAAAAGAIGAGIGLTINEVMEKKFPEAEKAVEGFFGGITRFFSSDLDNIMTRNEAYAKKNADQNLKLFGSESVRLTKEADKLKQEAKSARNEVFGFFGDEEEAKKLEAKEKVIRAQATAASRKYMGIAKAGTINSVSNSQTVTDHKAPATNADQSLSKVEIESNDTRKSDKEKFAEFLLGEFIDTFVNKLNVGGGDQQMPNNSIGINPNG